MGSYHFRWEHPAEEVYVTGTFDNWTRRTKLYNRGSVHERVVELPAADQKIFYKFVADGVWKHDPDAKTETDYEGNINNVLYPEDISSTSSTLPHISSVGPASSTLAMAGQQPVTPSGVPGAFPETPALDGSKSKGILDGAAPSSSDASQAFSVNPIPASAGIGNPISLAPGEKVPAPSTFNSNTISSGVHDDPELKRSEPEQTLSINPIPATGGIGNPITLAPGEKVPDPSTLTSNTVASTVKLDPVSYEKSDTGAPVLPPVLTPQSEREAAGAAIFTGLGPQTTNMVSEPSAGTSTSAADTFNPTISSAAPTSTTAMLAGQQPLEPRGVPQVVAASQQEAGVAPEASANPTAVAEKKELESELKARVPEEKPASTGNEGTIATTVTGALAGLGAAATAGAVYAHEKATQQLGQDPVSYVQDSVQKVIGGASAISQQSGAPTQSATSPTVPSEVIASQREAQIAPEASANPVAVAEKSALEDELLSKISPSNTSGAPAPTLSASTSAVAPVKDAALAAATAATTRTSTTATSSAPSSSALNASASSPAQPSTTTSATPVHANGGPPTTTTQTKPVVTTGIASATAPTTSSSVPEAVPRPSASTTSTPAKRNSFMGRLRGTPESGRPSSSASSAILPGKDSDVATTGTGTDASDRRKKGFFSKIKEKLSK